MKTIGISAKITSDEALRFASTVAADLRGRGLGVCFDYATADKLNDRGKCVAKGELGKHSDLLMTFGGDGTLLSVARHAPNSVPILGVNMGTLGFLTEVRVEEFAEVLERVLADDYETEERVAFDANPHTVIAVELICNIRDRRPWKYQSARAPRHPGDA